MAKGFQRAGRRGGGIPPVVFLVAGGVVLLLLVGSVFWFASQADSKKPPLQEIRVEATNVGPK